MWIKDLAAVPLCRDCRRAIGEMPKQPNLVCLHCHEQFWKPSSHRAQKFCSASCDLLFRGYTLNPTAEQTRARNLRKLATRRAKRRAAFVEVVDSRYVFERDDWRCHLCRRKCRRDVDGMHPQGATVDHIVPLSKGGDHSLANVATAHRSCNIRKGNRAGGEQLALLG
jgi:5-methylcytosine-specific restriction endonuclease McrA